MKKSKISLWSSIVFIKKQPLVIICLMLSIILASIPYITANLMNCIFVKGVNLIFQLASEETKKFLDNRGVWC